MSDGKPSEQPSLLLQQRKRLRKRRERAIQKQRLEKQVVDKTEKVFTDYSEAAGDFVGGVAAEVFGDDVGEAVSSGIQALIPGSVEIETSDGLSAEMEFMAFEAKVEVSEDGVGIGGGSELVGTEFSGNIGPAGLEGSAQSPIGGVDASVGSNGVDFSAQTLVSSVETYMGSGGINYRAQSLMGGGGFSVLPDGSFSADAEFNALGMCGLGFEAGCDSQGNCDFEGDAWFDPDCAEWWLKMAGNTLTGIVNGVDPVQVHERTARSLHTAFSTVRTLFEGNASAVKVGECLLSSLEQGVRSDGLFRGAVDFVECMDEGGEPTTSHYPGNPRS